MNNEHYMNAKLGQTIDSKLFYFKQLGFLVQGASRAHPLP
jgi:hypothetical protein